MQPLQASNVCKPKGSPCQGLTAAILACCIGDAGISLFGPTAKLFKDVLNLTHVQVSWLIAMPTLSGSLLRIPLGASVDETGGRKPLLALLGISILGMVGVSVVLHQTDDELKKMPEMYPLLLVLGGLVGCGFASFVVGAGQASYWFPREQQGKVLGLYGGVGNLPPGIIALILPLALKQVGLFWTYLVWLLALFLGTMVYFCFGQNAWYFQLRKRGVPLQEAEHIARENYGQELFPKGNTMNSLGAAASDWKTWALVGLYFVTFGGWVALTTWLPLYWQEFHRLPATSAGFLTFTYSVGCSAIRALIGGPLADAMGGEPTLLGSLTVMCAGALCLACSHEYSVNIAGMELLSLSMGVSNAAIFKLVPQYVPKAIGGATGWVGGLGGFGGFALPPVLAKFVAAQGLDGYSQGFFVYVGMAAFALFIVSFLQFTKHANRDVAPFERLNQT